jgi:outer membrane murein-binding lipoprotein Lpp
MKSMFALVLAFAAGSAFAHGCPGEMKAIDTKMPSVKMDAAQMTKVKDLRAKGEQLHKDGKHTESMAALAEAKKLLGM